MRTLLALFALTSMLSAQEPLSVPIGDFAKQLKIFAVEWRELSFTYPPSLEPLQAARAAALADPDLKKSTLAQSYVIKYFDDLIDVANRRAKLQSDFTKVSDMPKPALSPLSTSAWRKEERERLEAQWQTRLNSSAKTTDSIVATLEKIGPTVRINENAELVKSLIVCFDSLKTQKTTAQRVARSEPMRFRVLLVVPEGLYVQLFEKKVIASSASSVGMGGSAATGWELTSKTGLVTGYKQPAAEDDEIEVQALQGGVKKITSLSERTLRVWEVAN